ncbi:hypothetical protein C8R44DRAFT_738238 [Mycena epipterygia]|nr:hypothetical protein C8R44DRAFT_738238 [Mycena epipterygia]
MSRLDLDRQSESEERRLRSLKASDTRNFIKRVKGDGCPIAVGSTSIGIQTCPPLALCGQIYTISKPRGSRWRNKTIHTFDTVPKPYSHSNYGWCNALKTAQLRDTRWNLWSPSVSVQQCDPLEKLFNLSPRKQDKNAEPVNPIKTKDVPREIAMDIFKACDSTSRMNAPATPNLKKIGRGTIFSTKFKNGVAAIDLGNDQDSLGVMVASVDERKCYLRSRCAGALASSTSIKLLSS